MLTKCTCVPFLSHNHLKLEIIFDVVVEHQSPVSEISLYLLTFRMIRLALATH